MSRKSPESRDVYVERRITDRYESRRATNRHARKVQTFERNVAAASWKGFSA